MKDFVFTDVVKHLEKNDHFRLVAFGASNTERYMPGMHWLDVLEIGLRIRFGRKFQIINSGVCGNNTREALERFDRDVALFRPALVIVTLGGNDCNPDPAKYVPPAEFRHNLEKIAARIQALGAIPIFQTYYKMILEGMIPERARNFVANMEIIRELAKEHKWNLVDQYALFDRINSETHTYELMINASHTNEAGNLLIGVELLRHFDVDPYQIPHMEKLLPAIRMSAMLNQSDKKNLEREE